jgi:hypothetical protein
MHLIQKVRRKSIAYNTLTLFAAIALSTAVATDALAAGNGRGSHGAARGFESGHIGDEFRTPGSIFGPVYGGVDEPGPALWGNSITDVRTCGPGACQDNPNY